MAMLMLPGQSLTAAGGDVGGALCFIFALMFLTIVQSLIHNLNGSVKKNKIKNKSFHVSP